MEKLAWLCGASLGLLMRAVDWLTNRRRDWTDSEPPR